MSAVAVSLIAARTLVPKPLFEVLARRTVTDFGVDPAVAEAVMDQALAFLATASLTEQPLGLRPSAAVDPGWHALLLYPQRCREFFERIGGRHVDHVPDDDPFATSALASTGSASLASTVEAITRAGYVVDPQLWTVRSDKCTSCHENGACGASGADGDENTENRNPDPS